MIQSKVGSDFLEAVVERVAEKLLPQIIESLNSKLVTQKDITMDPEEVARYIGVSKDTIYKMCADGSIPHLKVGAANSRKKKYLFSSLSIDKWRKEQEEVNYTKKGTVVV
ncbi:helix-turn-helix domain-containing protein [Paenibacillus gallinarum]|uniref:Helix-turn-helix domain-containing protein n=1 Tax=Paenibacillus gallinarum TaxID=2762232 RepID=A0ABR8SW24_9BACL|nr:helix-turn-helix domain-containing protein [Paenibacillus gallinarum]MBD7967712.1 helix-turn-helix domain-containing protein [Paenibacillus gallinarum]